MPFDLEMQLAQTWPPGQWQDVTVLLAVSGGSDSVALLRAMKSLKTAGSGQLLAVHFNHGLRGEGSDADEAFVVDLCRRLEVPCRLGHAPPTLRRRHGGEGLEAVARRGRYDFFRHSAARAGARYLVTGHTADDQVETILHHILRGTGIAGLAGMARCRALSEATTLIRPLLGMRRAELIGYLDQLNQRYQTDSSNVDTQLTRNCIRHELLPLLAERFNPTIDEALLRLGTLAGQVQSVVDGLVEGVADQAVDFQEVGASINVAIIADEPRYLVRELLIHVWRRRGWPLQSMGYAEWDEMAEMLLSGRPKKKMFPGGVLAKRVEDRLCLRREEKMNDG